jgi:M6 family metalloprotease-like protein
MWLDSPGSPCRGVSFLAVYADESDAPGTLIATSSPISIYNCYWTPRDTEYEYVFPSPFTLHTGSYWLMPTKADGNDTVIFGSSYDIYDGGYWSGNPSLDAYFRLVTVQPPVRDINVAVILAEPQGTPHSTATTSQPCKLLNQNTAYPGHTKAYYDDLLHCVKNYHLENSYGTVNFNFTVFDNGGSWYNTAKTYTYYADGHEPEFIDDTIAAATSAGVDLGGYQAIAAVHSGMATREYSQKSYQMESQVLPIAASPFKTVLAEDNFVGGWAHEMGHIEGAILTPQSTFVPDLVGMGDVGQWDLMARGSRNNGENDPPQMSSYTKEFLQFLHYDIVSSSFSGFVNIPTLISEKFGDAAVRYNLATSTQDDDVTPYYLLEARNKSVGNWDTSIPTSQQSALVLYYVNPLGYSEYGYTDFNGTKYLDNQCRRINRPFGSVLTSFGDSYTDYDKLVRFTVGHIETSSITADIESIALHNLDFVGKYTEVVLSNIFGFNSSTCPFLGISTNSPLENKPTAGNSLSDWHFINNALASEPLGTTPPVLFELHDLLGTDIGVSLAKLEFLWISLAIIVLCVVFALKNKAVKSFIKPSILKIVILLIMIFSVPGIPVAWQLSGSYNLISPPPVQFREFYISGLTFDLVVWYLITCAIVAIAKKIKIRYFVLLLVFVSAALLLGVNYQTRANLNVPPPVSQLALINLGQEPIPVASGFPKENSLRLLIISIVALVVTTLLLWRSMSYKGDYFLDKKPLKGVLIFILVLALLLSVALILLSYYRLEYRSLQYLPLNGGRLDIATARLTNGVDLVSQIQPSVVEAAVAAQKGLAAPISNTGSLPDLDLHAVTPDGRHVGMNYATGQYENQITGAIVSGDNQGSPEWILIPDGVQARFYVSAHDNQAFLAANPDIAGQLTTTTDSYEIYSRYIDPSSGIFTSPTETNQTIAPAQNVVYAVQGTSTPVVSQGVVDNQPPTITHAPLNSEYTLNSAPLAFTFSADDGSGVGVATTTATLDSQPFASGQNISFALPGHHTIVITSSDFLGNTTSTTLAYDVVYSFSGFLPPVKSDGSGIYKKGRTLPVKFQLTDANSQFAASAVSHLFLAKIQDGIAGTEEIALSTSAADTGNQFRYDSQANQYIFNLDTSSLSVGTWQLKVEPDDGTSHAVIVSIRS